MKFAIPRVITMPARDLCRACTGAQPPTSDRYFSRTKWNIESAKT